MNVYDEVRIRKIEQATERGLIAKGVPPAKAREMAKELAKFDKNYLPELANDGSRIFKR